jgi:hypothetical protein
MPKLIILIITILSLTKSEYMPKRANITDVCKENEQIYLNQLKPLKTGFLKHLELIDLDNDYMK